MKKFKKSRFGKKAAAILLLFTVSALALTGCGSSESTTDSSDSETTAEEVITITVASDGGTAPFNYQDDDGNLVGYEVDILNEIADRLGNVEIEFTVVEWDGIFAQLDSGKVDMIVNNITYKEERAEKYLYSDVSYYTNHTVIVVQEGNPENIQTIDDLQGVSIESISGNAVSVYLEAYNEEHSDNPIDLVYSDNKTATMLQNIATGRYVAGIWSESYVNEAVEQLGLELDVISIEEEEDIQDPAAWFLYSQTDEGEELKALVDPVLQELKDDGTLAELSIEWFGDDYVTENE